MRDPVEEKTVLEEIVELSSCYRERRPDAEVTKAEYAAAKGISLKRTERVLEDLVERGELATELVMNEGHVTRVWWRVDP
jgi:hypothetical protein